jgi:tetratricopeptide (TPR) repeat protein
LTGLLSNENATSKTGAQPLSHQRIALAGRLASLTRTQAADLIQHLGGRYHPRVTPQTTMIVIGSRHLPLRQDGRVSRNLRLANELQADGCPLEIVDEQTFLTLVGLRDDSGQSRRTLGELADLVGISRQRLRAWWTAGLITSLDTEHGIEHFDYQQVVTVKYLAELMQAGVKTARLRHSLHQLSQWMPNANLRLANLDLLAGEFVIRRDDGRLADVAGQLLMEFDEHVQTSSVSFIPTVEYKPFDDLFHQGCQLEELGDFTAARDAYELCLNIHGEEATVLFNLGNVQRELGNLHLTESHYRRAIALDPSCTQVWINLGDTLADLGHDDGAIEAWQRAIELDADCQEALFNLADALESQRRRTEAAKYWTMYLNYDDNSVWADYARNCLQDQLVGKNLAIL